MDWATDFQEAISRLSLLKNGQFAVRSVSTNITDETFVTWKLVIYNFKAFYRFLVNLRKLELF